MSIQGFDCKVTAKFFEEGRGHHKAGWFQCAAVVARKLDMIDAAAIVSDLEAPPGDQLEQLKGDLEGLWSIRVNDQWRVTFVWDGAEPEQVAVVDYH